jgi:hypothetical protein
LTYRIVARIVDQERSDFDVPVELVVTRNPSGYDLFFGRERLSGGRHRNAALADGVYVLRTESTYYQPAERADIAIPATGPYLVDLLPGVAYPFPAATLPGGRGPTLLRGAYQASDGTGIESATVTAAGRAISCRTDATGQWVLVFPDDEPAGDVTVRIVDGAVTHEAAHVAVLPGRQAALAPTVLVGLVTAAGIAVPDAVITIANHPDNTRSATDGSWRYVFPPDQGGETVTVAVLLPDGRQQTSAGVQIQPRTTGDVPAFIF